jgi:hypothetical protein
VHQHALNLGARVVVGMIMCLSSISCDNSGLTLDRPNYGWHQESTTKFSSHARGSYSETEGKVQAFIQWKGQGMRTGADETVLLVMEPVNGVSCERYGLKQGEAAASMVMGRQGPTLRELACLESSYFAATRVAGDRINVVYNGPVNDIYVTWANGGRPWLIFDVTLPNDSREVQRVVQSVKQLTEDEVHQCFDK